MGIVLNIIASVLIGCFGWAGYLYAMIKLSKSDFNAYNKQIAIAKDQYANGLMSVVFNTIMIKEGGYCFGNIDETISSVIGKNYKTSTLTFFGKGIYVILDKIDYLHSIKAIDLISNWNIFKK